MFKVIRNRLDVKIILALTFVIVCLIGINTYVDIRNMQLDTIRNVKINRRTNKPSEEENPPAPVPLNSRLGKLTWITWSSTQQPTQGQLDAYAILETEFPPVYNQVKQLGEVEIPALEKGIESLGGPVTPGRLPEWKK